MAKEVTKGGQYRRRAGDTCIVTNVVGEIVFFLRRRGRKVVAGHRDLRGFKQAWKCLN